MKKLYLGLGILFILIIFVVLTYPINYKGFEKALANEQCIMVVEIPPTSFSSSLFKAKGYDPQTKEPCLCIENNRWWSSYKNEIEVGDTIMKKKGELIFSIHKKDSVIIHKYKL